MVGNQPQTCFHEEQIQGMSRKIAELETRADYKEKSIMEIKEDIKEVMAKMDTLDTTINNFILKSVNDDGELREIINKQDNRITALETTNRTLKWILGISLTGLGTAVTILAFVMAHIH